MEENVPLLEPRGLVLAMMNTMAACGVQRGKAGWKSDSRSHVHSSLCRTAYTNSVPLSVAPAPLVTGGHLGGPATCWKAQMPVTKAGPGNSLEHGTSCWRCPWPPAREVSWEEFERQTFYVVRLLFCSAED